MLTTILYEEAMSQISFLFILIAVASIAVSHEPEQDIYEVKYVATMIDTNIKEPEPIVTAEQFWKVVEQESATHQWQDYEWD